MRVGADGAVAPVADLGTIDTLSSLQVAFAGDGSARVLWSRPGDDGDELVLARVDSAGAVSDSVRLTNGRLAGAPRLTAAGGAAIVGWVELGEAAGAARLRAARLPASGPVAANPVTIADEIAAVSLGVGAVIAPDGTATFAWTQADEQTFSGPVATRQLAPDGALSAVRTISAPATGTLDFLPQLANGHDGAIVAIWLRGVPAADTVLVGGGRVLDRGGVPVGSELTVPLSISLRGGFNGRFVALTRVTVKGTLDRRASGRVTVTWVQKLGRRTVRRTARVKIVRGRFTATVRLPRVLARARTVGRLTVTYGGDADVASARATRVVRAGSRRATTRRASRSPRG